MSAAVDPVFTAERNPRHPGWHVEVFWPWGTRTTVRHFETEEEAKAWIERRAQDWLYGQGRGPGAPQRQEP